MGALVSVTSHAKPAGTEMLHVPVPPLVVQVCVTVGLLTSEAVKTAPLGRGLIVVVLPLRTPPACTTMVGSGGPAAGT